MDPVIQAIIPQIGEPLKSSHLTSFAEAFNTRIKNGAGDSHWRIPYYIFSTYFRKPRLDDKMLYTPESEFFDFYQFVNPFNQETWPTNPPQQPEGANLQTNFLNRFIFGMNYQKKDPDGSWIYEREDVKVQIAQSNLKAGDITAFRGCVFPFFTAVGTNNGEGKEYTSFGLSSEIYSPGYISGEPKNPQGNSFGGYYGKNPLIVSADGCGTDEFKSYPSSNSYIYKLDGVKDDTSSLEVYEKICNEGIGTNDAPSEYSIVNSSNPNSILAFTINRSDNSISKLKVLPKNKYHVNQFQSTVFFGREQKNHIHRLLYNYITYARGFDFDWFFNNQYSFSPEIGSFSEMTCVYDKNPTSDYARLDLLDTKIKVTLARPIFQKPILNNSTVEFLEFFSGYNYKSISDGASIKRKYLNNDGKTYTDLAVISGTASIINFLANNDFLADGYSAMPQYLYSTYDNNGVKVVSSQYNTLINIPLGYTLNNIEVSASDVKKCTIRIYIFLNGKDTGVRKDFIFDYSNISSGETIPKSVSGDVFLATINPNVNYGVKFEVRDITLTNPSVSGSITLEPVFLFSYKPKIEDAYALLRVCTYYGLKDGNLDEGKLTDSGHPLNRAQNFSDKLKEEGVLGGDSISIPVDKHGALSFELNNNALYEASRRLSLFTRIVSPNYFNSIIDKRTLKFKRYALQSASRRAANTNKITLAQETVTVPYNIFAEDDDIYNCEIYINYKQALTDDIVYYKNFKKYYFKYQDSYDKIFTQLSNALVSTFNKSLNNYEKVNNNKIEFAPISYSFNYDCLFHNEEGGFFVFFTFEDIKGVKYYTGSQDAPTYIAKKYSLIDQEFIDVNVSQEAGTVNLFDALTEAEKNALGKSFVVYMFRRSPNEEGLATSRSTGRRFYHVDKNGSFINKIDESICRYNYLATRAIPMASFNWSAETESNTLPEEALFDYLIPKNGNVQISLTPSVAIQDIDTVAEYVLTLSDLTDLANVLYSEYARSSIQLDGSEVVFKQNTDINNFVDFSTFSASDYNKYLAGYKVYLSYFDRYTNTEAFETSFETAPTFVTVKTLDSNNNIINTIGVYPFKSQITLPSLTGAEEKFSFEITVNNRLNKTTKDKVNLPIYLAIVNVSLQDEDPLLEPINRDGSIFISREASLVATDTAATTSRDIFQGIAPDINGVLSGDLQIGQEYIASGGSITHAGITYSDGSTFKAVNNDYIVSGAGAIVLKKNGITEIAPPKGFSNEWIFWINFLPYSGSPTSSFKEEVYGATNSPFIDRCHINSKLIARSEENSYFNLGLPKTYIPEMPPSYRYVPLISKGKLVFENIIGDNQYKELFYKGCKAFNPPYQIKKAYIKSDDLNFVYIELDRDIDGFGSDRSTNPLETFRTDSNGLLDWINKGPGFGKATFRVGDSSITNDSGINQIVSNTANGYQGSYYPRFFFVKLIPKPYSDNNNTQESNDSPTNHEIIKQAELYLEAMREGFTAGPSSSMGNLSCASIKGHLTTPDYKYDQLLFNSTSTADYYGNKWPSLLTFSQNFNVPSISYPNYTPIALRYEDNPKGFGAIPFVGTYLEPYYAIAKSINNLLRFRVPFPLSYTSTQYSYINNTTNLNPTDWDNTTYKRIDKNNNEVGTGPLWADFQSDSSVSNIIGQQGTISSVTTYNLRNDSGFLIPVTATQGYHIGDNGGTNLNLNLANAYISKFYIKATLNLKGIDNLLKDTSYYYINELLPTTYSTPIFVDKVKTITSLIPLKSLSDSGSCLNSYRIGSNTQNDPYQYFTLKGLQTDQYLSCEIFGNAEVLPETLRVGKPFYRVIDPVGCEPGNLEKFNLNSFRSDSTTTFYIFETGFQIATLKISGGAISS